MPESMTSVDPTKPLAPWSDFEKLAQILANLKGHFVLSINDTPETRTIFAAHRIEEITTTYSAGSSCGHSKRAQDLLITNA
ncbi:MAG: hypothetical protein AAF442_04910 [Pseudomonadota bacterium]